MRIKTTPRVLHLEVPNISKLDEFWSPDVIVRGIPWKIKAKKQENESKFSLYIHLFCEDHTPNKSYVASATVKLLSKNLPIEKYIEPDVFDHTDLGSGLAIIPWLDLMDASKGYVTENDSINLHITIKANDPNDSRTSTLHFENMDKCCDEGGLATYRLTISNVDNLMAVQSPQFLLRNMAWRLTAFKSHLGYLSIRLESNDESEDITCKVNVMAKLKSSSNSIELNASKQFKCYNIIEVVWKELPWDQFLNPEKGFVENNQAIIEVEIKADKPELINPNKRKYKAKNHQSNAKLVCTICLKRIGSQSTSFTPCGHLFCSTCIRNAIKRSGKCPKTSCNRHITLKQLKRAHLSFRS